MLPNQAGMFSNWSGHKDVTIWAIKCQLKAKTFAFKLRVTLLKKFVSVTLYTTVSTHYEHTYNALQVVRVMVRVKVNSTRNYDFTAL